MLDISRTRRVVMRAVRPQKGSHMLTAEDLKKRRIGGSTISAIMGMNPFASPLDAYREVTAALDGTQLARIESDDIDRGNFLEPACREWLGKKILAREIEQPGVVQHPEYPFATVTPDAIFTLSTEKVLGEIKCPRYGFSDWGEEGTDEIPHHAHMQVQWGLEATRLRRGVVGALIGGNLRIYWTEIDHDLVGLMMENAARFWRDHIVTRKAPPPTFGERDAEWIKQRFAKETKPPAPFDLLSPEERALTEKFIALKQAKKSIEDRLEPVELQLREMIGERGGILGDGWRIDFKLKKGSPAWKKVAEKLAADLKLAEADLEKLADSMRGVSPRELKGYGKMFKEKTE